MAAFTTPKLTRVEQCRKNAHEKSEAKRKSVFEALAALRKDGKPVTKSAVARRAGVSVVFIRSHSDLVQAVEEADKAGVAVLTAPTDPRATAKETVIAALRRRLDDMKAALDAKEANLRQKQREIDSLYGKLATGSPVTDAELHAKLQEALRRVSAAEQQVANLKKALFAKRYVRMARKARGTR